MLRNSLLDLFKEGNRGILLSPLYGLTQQDFDVLLPHVVHSFHLLVCQPYLHLPVVKLSEFFHGALTHWLHILLPLLLLRILVLLLQRYSSLAIIRGVFSSKPHTIVVPQRILSNKEYFVPNLLIEVCTFFQMELLKGLLAKAI